MLETWYNSNVDVFLQQLKREEQTNTNEKMTIDKSV
jgi:hypothetical protein